MKKFLRILTVFILSFCFFNRVQAIILFDNQVGTYEEELVKFPTDYQNKIKELHNIYPNAIFVKQDKFFSYKNSAHPERSYKEVTVSWNDMLNAEKYIKYDKNYAINKIASPTSEIEASAKPDSYKSGVCGEWRDKEKGICAWYAASEEGIIYYLNPYNFLDEKHVFMFQSQYYNSSETEVGVNNILTDAFKNKECPGSNGKTYAQVILEVAHDNNISAYMLASRLVQENGRGTSPLVTGKCLDDGENCTKYYNLYNIQASGSTDAVKISNGIKCASGTLIRESDKNNLCKGYNWTSPYLSIKGGAHFIQSKYIGVNDTYSVKGQMTNYLQKWDPYGPNLAGHQYMQNIRAPYYEAESTYNSNMKYMGKDFKYIFYIPIFEGAPNTSNSTPTVKLGDINSDGKIDSGDLFVLQKYLIGKSELTNNQRLAADINKDNLINSGDIFKLVQHLIGKINLNG